MSTLFSDFFKKNFDLYILYNVLNIQTDNVCNKHITLQPKQTDAALPLVVPDI